MDGRGSGGWLGGDGSGTGRENGCGRRRGGVGSFSGFAEPQNESGKTGDLQNRHVGANPDVVADSHRLTDAVPLEALVEPHGICGMGFCHLAVFPPDTVEGRGTARLQLGCWLLLAGRERHPNEPCGWREGGKRGGNLRVTPTITQLAPMLQPSPMTTSATGVSMIMQLRLINVEPPTCSRSP